MTAEVQEFACTVPAGTAQNTPASFPLEFAARNVDRIHVTVPPGCKGAVGFWIGTAGVQLIPLTLGAWVVRDGAELDYTLTGFHNSGIWQLVAYNVGNYPHTLRVEFSLSLLYRPTPGLVPVFTPPELLSQQ